MASYKDKVTEATRLLEVMEAGQQASLDLAKLCYEVVDMDGVELLKLADYVDHLRRRGKRHETPTYSR
jgi:hypothetical protein